MYRGVYEGVAAPPNPRGTRRLDLPLPAIQGWPSTDHLHPLAQQLGRRLLQRASQDGPFHRRRYARLPDRNSPRSEGRVSQVGKFDASARTFPARSRGGGLIPRKARQAGPASSRRCKTEESEHDGRGRELARGGTVGALWMSPGPARMAGRPATPTARTKRIT